MTVFNNDVFKDHESIHFFNDPDSGLRAIIAVHSTRLGPAAGGTRFWHYATDDEAIRDALNLSRGMSYKNAMAGIPFGGGKGVIIRPDGDIDRAALFTAYGKAIETLGGLYFTAEDVGVTPDDMAEVAKQTSYVAGLDEGDAASGDPSPVTAVGVFRCMKVALRRKFGQPDFKGRTVAVQGIGHVGFSLCRHLHEAGAELIVTDINEAALRDARDAFGAQIVKPDAIYAAKADIFAPCALGGTISTKSLRDFSAQIICGAANNQLYHAAIGEMVHERGILYCPDYVVNGGGIINVAAELSGHYDPDWVDGKLSELAETLDEIIAQSDSAQLPTNVIADRLAEKRIYGNALPTDASS